MLEQAEAILQILLSSCLGGILGYERERIHKPAGLRTYIFVTLGATLFTILAQKISLLDGSGESSRIVAAILTGIGFIGAGVIIHRSNHHIEGITTAAGLWLTSAIGIAVGIRMYFLAVFTTFFAFLILAALGKAMKDTPPKSHSDVNQG